MDMTYVRMTQDNYNATQHLIQRRAESKAKKAKKLRVRIGIVLSTLIVTACSVAFMPKANAMETEPEVQQYIVRYGRAWNWGRQIQMNDDRSIIDTYDAPELAEGTDVRVLFDTHGTSDTSDDTVVDITEL